MRRTQQCNPVVRDPLPGSFQFVSGCALGLWSATMLLLVCLTHAHAANLPTSAIRQQVYRLQDLKDSQGQEAIRQLTAIKQQLPDNAQREDRLLVLGELISFNLDEDREDVAQQLISELNDWAERTNDDYARALKLNFDAQVLYNHGHLPEAKKRIDAASQLAQKVNQPRLIRRIALVASMISAELGDFKSSLQEQLIALSTMDAGDPHDNLPRINAMTNIASIYLQIKNPNRALGYVDEGIKIAKNIAATKSIIKLTSNQGAAYADLKNYPAALTSHRQALEFSRKIADLRDEYIALANLTDTYYRMEDFEQCSNYAKQAFHLAQKQAIDKLLPGAYVNVGLCEMGSGHVETGAKKVNLGIAGLRNANATVDIVKSLRALAGAYERAGRYKEANRIILEQDELSGELTQLRGSRAVAEIQARYDETEWQKRIEQLNEKNDLQTAELKNSRQQRWFGVIAFFLVAIIAYLLIHSKEHSRKLAMQENQNKSKFVADAAHDLRQPMQAIGNLLEATKHAMERNDAPKSLELIGLAQTATRVMRSSFNAVLELSRLQSGLVKPEYKAFDLKNLIDEMLISFGDFASERGIAIRVRFNPKRRLVIWSDRVLLGRVLSNLMLNAIKYGDPAHKTQPFVVVGIVALGARYRIDIQDNGLGIAPADQQNIFKPFFQVNNPERNPENGLGLGLSNVQAILELLKDHAFRMQSALGSGTRFSVYVPKSDLLEFPDTAGGTELAAADVAGIYVLYVEDNLLVRSSTTALLAEYGILCETCNSYDETVQRLAGLERMPDILITDYSLPDEKNAGDVIAAVNNEFGCDLPTIVITGDGQDIRSLVPLKTFTLLHKPLSPMALLKEILELSKKRN